MDLRQPVLGRTIGFGDIYKTEEAICLSTSARSAFPPEALSYFTRYSINFRYLLTDTINEKFNLFEVPSALQCRILDRSLEVKGSAIFLYSEKSPAKGVRVSLLCTVTTKTAHVKKSNMKRWIAVNQEHLIECAPSITSMITKITYGGMIVVTVQDSNEDDRDATQVVDELTTRLTRIIDLLQRRKFTDKGDLVHYTHLSWTVYSDFAERAVCCQTFRQVFNHIENVIESAQYSNAGLGMPIFYTMQPLHDVQYRSVAYPACIPGAGANVVCKQPARCNSQSASVQERVPEDGKDSFQSRDQGKNDAKQEAQKNTRQLYAEQAYSSRSQKNKTESQSAEPLLNDKPKQPTERSQTITGSARYRHQDFGECSSSEGLSMSTACAISPNQTAKEVTNVHTVTAKRKSSIEENLTTASQQESNIKPTKQMHSQEHEPQGYSKRTTMQDRQVVIIPSVSSQKPALQQTSVGMPFHNDKQANSGSPKFKAEGQPTHRQDRDAARFDQTPAEGPPKSCNDTCAKILNGNILEGDLSVDHLSGSCPPHGQCADSKEEVKGNSVQAVYILILGESGVGKSTWINGVANYLAYSTMEEAARNKPVHVINSSFRITDDDYNDVLVSMGPGGDGTAELGASATQTTKFYPLTAGGRTLRLIDTPGIGDTRGVDKDQENVRNIFSHLARLPVLHGICVLLKPNSARMNTAFQFCIQELLAHLHRDACRNIVFVFTNSRGTFYRPGDTFPTLSKLLRENKVDILLDRKHVYCMDNEPVRFLAATMQGMTFTDSDKDNYSRSWEVSKAETDRLIAHVSSLKPHAVEFTLRLNEAMNASLAVSGSLVAFAKALQIEIIRQVELHCRETQKISKRSGDPEGRFSKIKMVVCCNNMCKRASTRSSSSGRYFSICHQPCNHNILISDRIGCEDIKECEVMDKQNEKCIYCKCCWCFHMCISYKPGTEHSQESGSRKYNGTNAGRQLPSKSELYLLQLKSEQQSILKAGAQLGIFLKQNTIGACSDVIAEQLERAALPEVLATYKTEAIRIEDELRQKAAMLQFTEVRQSFSTLCGLPIAGKKLERVVGVWNACFKTDYHHACLPKISAKNNNMTGALPDA